MAFDWTGVELLMLRIWKIWFVFLDILLISKYRLNPFCVLLFVKEQGVLEGLASNRLGLEIKGGYLAVYFGLLLFSLGGVMLQGGIYMLIGVAAWISVVFGWFICYHYLPNAISLKAEALNEKCYLGREVDKELESS